MSGVARPTKGRLSGLSDLMRKRHGPLSGGRVPFILCPVMRLHRSSKVAVKALLYAEEVKESE